jgi:hypothetical protein
MSHLEDLLVEWHDWRGYVVKRNVKVGRLGHGGWAGELDIVAYHPSTEHLIHYEPSLDAHPWTVRERRFGKKFASGRKYIYAEVFPWLRKDTPLEQVAVLVSKGAARSSLAGASVVTIDELMRQIRAAVSKEGKMAKRAIPEQYPLLRTVQLFTCGYYRAV